jgi:tetratricopeptide (TPR) repeat protein
LNFLSVPDEALEALRSGEYDRAISAYQSLVRVQGAPPDHYVGLVRALMAVGRYDDAEKAARDGVERHGAELQAALGRALQRQLPIRYPF